MVRLFGTRTIAFLLFLGSLFPARAIADAPQPGEAHIEMPAELLPNGDGTAVLTLHLSARDYVKAKATSPNPYQFLREYTSDRTNVEMARGAKCRYDDEHNAIVMEFTQLGAVKCCGGGTWEMPIEKEAEFVDLKTIEGRTKLFFYATGKIGESMPVKGQETFLLPAAATKAEWDGVKRVIRYHLPEATRGGSCSLSCDLRTKPNLMTVLYKVYGRGQDFPEMWAAKAVFHNTGDGCARDFQVRFKIDGYSEWSLWEKTPVIVAGETVVSVFYPLFDRSIATLQSDTPEDIRIEWQYTDSEGKRREESDGRRTLLMGVHEIVYSDISEQESLGTFQEDFSNANALAAFVAREDAVVNELAALANKRANGRQASRSDEDAIAVLRQCYEIEVDNRFSYQGAVAQAQGVGEVDMQSVQSLKFPRDVIRYKSGTCVELAILYASMANAVGLKPYLLVKDQHCFPIVELPSGDLLPVEATGIGGDAKQWTFADAVDEGRKKLDAVMRTGRYVLVDVRKQWSRGISNPELDPLPANVLSQWGITENGTRRPAEPPHATPDPAPAPQPRNDGNHVTVEGTWVAQVENRMANGQVVTYPVVLIIQANKDGSFSAAAAEEIVSNANGQPVHLKFEEELVGRIADNALVLKGTRATWTNMNSGQQQNVQPDTCVFHARGEELVADVTNPQSAPQQLLFTRK